MPVETFRGYLAALVAAFCVVGGAAGLLYVAAILPPSDPPRDLALAYGVIGSLITGGTTFLWLQDSSARASHATERAHEQGVIAGATMPAQAPRPIVVTTTPEPEEPLGSGMADDSNGDTVGG